MDIPVIMTTTDSDPFKVEDNIRAGVDELFVKPYDMNMLKLSVSRILINRQIIRNKYLNADTEKINSFNFNCKSEKDFNFIARIIEIIDKNIEDTEFTVDTLCAQLHMSRTTFYNKLKDVTDHPPKEIIRIVKLQRAAQLLKESKLNVTEVADKVGFNDSKYFRVVFKGNFGMTPKDYIAKYRNQQPNIT
ncbi:MAG: DNA-binding response regulator [Bacteroides sp.]|nr:DNA-binding response regulator [Bacteroides sp.]